MRHTLHCKWSAFRKLIQCWYKTVPILIWYILFLILLVILPLNSKESKVNDIYFLELRLDYLVHLIMFLPYGFLVLWRQTGLDFHRVKFWLLLLAGFALGAGVEGLQYLLPYRAFNINDLIANLIGVLLGIPPAVLLWVKSKAVEKK